MDIFLQFKHIFHGQSYFSATAIRFQVFKQWYKQPQKRRLVASI